MTGQTLLQFLPIPVMGGEVDFAPSLLPQPVPIIYYHIYTTEPLMNDRYMAGDLLGDT